MFFNAFHIPRALSAVFTNLNWLSSKERPIFERALRSLAFHSSVTGSGLAKSTTSQRSSFSSSHSMRCCHEAQLLWPSFGNETFTLSAIFSIARVSRRSGNHSRRHVNQSEKNPRFPHFSANSELEPITCGQQPRRNQTTEANNRSGQVIGSRNKKILGVA